jgi:hypothetical protein
MTSTLRAQLARSRQAASGSKRVEVVLDAETLARLKALMAGYCVSQSTAIIEAIRSDYRRMPIKPIAVKPDLTRQAL